MWWMWVLGLVVVIGGLAVVLQRRGATGIDGYRPRDSTNEGQVPGGGPPGGYGDGGGA